MTSAEPRQSPAALLVRAIYWATPVFFALDFFHGVSLRVPFLDALPGAKATYYAIEVACGIAILARLKWTAGIGLSESLVNITLLIVSTGAAYIGVLESAASPDLVIVNPFTPQAVASLTLSATVLAASYLVQDYELQAVAARRR